MSTIHDTHNYLIINRSLPPLPPLPLPPLPPKPFVEAPALALFLALVLPALLFHNWPAAAVITAAVIVAACSSTSATTTTEHPQAGGAGEGSEREAGWEGGKITITAKG